jgi:hypothetical protein
MKPTFVSILLLCTGSAYGQDLSDSLIAHFPMDNSPNDLISGLAPTVTSGTPGFCADRFGNPNGAACFDGASFWSYGDVLDMDTADFVISFWFSSDSEDGSRLVTKGNTIFGTPDNAGYSFGFGDGGGGEYVGSIYVYDDQANESTTAVPVEVSEWAHMVASRCDSILSVHVNGQLTSQVPTISHGDLSTNIVFAIGALDRNPTPEPDGSYFSGAIDDLRIYKGRCLTQAEIDTLYYGLTVDAASLGPIKSELRIHPNPSADKLWIASTNTQRHPGVLTVTDATGRKVVVRTVNSATVQLDVAYLKPGAYFVMLQDGHVQAHGRFIKE